VKERGILFSAPMVRAILAGTKTVTRRIVKWEPGARGLNLAFSGLDLGFYNEGNPRSGWVLRSRDGSGCWNDRTFPIHCPYGLPGDRLWVREAFTWITGNGIRAHYRADGEPTDREGNVLPTDPGCRRWMPSIHMPRKVCRIELDIVSVRVERLHEITEEDAKREGVDPFKHPGGNLSYRDAFAILWGDINGDRMPFDESPWVWRVEFTPTPKGK
jgi:hypothetical protein